MSQQTKDGNRKTAANQESGHNDSYWQRMILGCSAGLLLGAGLILAVWPGAESNSDQYFSGTLLKVGVVLGVAWLAAPQLERLGWHRVRGTLLVSLIIVLVLWAIRPRIGAWAAAIFLGGGAFFALIGWFRNLFDVHPSSPKNLDSK